MGSGTTRDDADSPEPGGASRERSGAEAWLRALGGLLHCALRSFGRRFSGLPKPGESPPSDVAAEAEPGVAAGVELPAGPIPRLFWLVFLTAVGFALLAIWRADHLPMGDLGGWIEQMDYRARYDDASTVYRGVLQMNHPLDPNTLAVRFAGLVSPLMRADTAAKVLVSWYVAGIPFALLAVCRAFGRSPWLALFGVPMVFNALFNLGILNYLVGLPFIFFGIALARTLARRGGWKRAVLLALCLVTVYFAHILVFLIAWATAGATFVLSVRRPRALLRAWCFLPAVPLPVLWYVHKFVEIEATGAGRAMAGAGGDPGFTYQPYAQRLGQLHDWGMKLLQSDTDERVVVVLIGSWLLMMVVAQEETRERVARGWRTVFGFLGNYTLEIVTFCCFWAYLRLPTKMREVDLIAERVPMIVAWLLVLWPRVRFDRLGQRLLLVPLVAVALGYPLFLRGEFQRFDDEVIDGMPEAVAALPARSRLGFVKLTRTDPIFHMGPLWHVAQGIHAVENGGINSDCFAIRPSSPFQFVPGCEPPKLDNDFWRDPDLFYYDYVLARSDHRPAGAWGEPALEQVYAKGVWYLFRVRHSLSFRDVREVRAGGSGGHPAFSDCTPGEVLTGVRGAFEKNALLFVEPECTSVAALASSAEGSVPAGPVVRGRVGGGGTGDRPFEQRCPPGGVVAGVYGSTGRVPRSFGLLCISFAEAAQPGRRDAERTLPAGSTTDGDPFEVRCPTGRVATGFRGRDGALVDEVGLACRRVGSIRADGPAGEDGPREPLCRGRAP